MDMLPLDTQSEREREAGDKFTCLRLVSKLENSGGEEEEK